MVLNKNPDNFFHENEQLAFCPSMIVPGKRTLLPAVLSLQDSHMKLRPPPCYDVVRVRGQRPLPFARWVGLSSDCR